MVKTNIQTFSGEVEILSNLHVGSYLTANGAASNVLDITGNVGATFFVGDGGFLSNIATTLNDITNQGNVISNVVTFEANTHYGGVGLVTSSNVGIRNTNPLHTLSVGDKVIFDDNTVESSGQSVIRVDGRILATRFQGDGGLLSNIATTLSSIVNQGNTASNVVIFNAADEFDSGGVGLVTNSNVGIQNTNPTFNLSVGSNLHVDDTGSNVLTVHGNVTASNLNLGVFSITPAYGLNDVCNTSNGTSNVVQFQNATTSLVATSNITVGGNVTAQSLISTSNVDVGDRLKFSGSNVFVDTLRVADVAANLVTYDRTTGELTDSGGTFLNKFAIVSEQPPSDLFANTTTVTDHGSYTLTTSNLATNSNTYNAFDGTANAWTGGTGMYIGGSNVLIETNLTQLSNLHPTQFGDWLAIEFPYKTTLRHMKLTPATVWQSFPYAANLYATNNDITWTEINYWNGLNPGSASNVQTITVNATEQFKKYALVTTKIVPNVNIASAVALQDWQLFTESFSIDGGKVAMAQQAATGGETVMDQHGPHGRGKAKLKKYPEIIFEEGKFDGSRTNADPTYDEQYYLQAGTTIKVVSETTSRVAHQAFNGDIVGANGNGWHTQFGFDRVTGLYDTSNDRGDTFTDTNGDPHLGMWIQTKFPNKIKVKNINLYIGNNLSRFPKSLVVLGHSSLSSLTGWTLVHSETDISTTVPAVGDTTPTTLNIDSDTAFDCYTILVKAIRTDISAGQNSVWVSEIEYYGYEEDPPAGDTSVDTTFKSIMNTPQTTGANVYVDGSLGETFTNRVVGPTVSNTHTTYVSAEKYWEFSGNVESNVTLEANTFLSGDAPHSLSMWFNSSNLVSNTSNSCIFSLGTEERLDHVGAAFSNTYQTVQKITAGSRSTSNSLFGHSCAINSDGTRMIVGALTEDTPQTDYGAVYIYTYSNGFWDGGVRIAAPTPVSGTAHQNFGTDVGISNDGNRVVVGARLDDTGGSDAGAAYVYSYSNGNWTLDTVSGVSTGRIQASAGGSATAGDRFGNSVAMSGDGTRIIVGAIYEDTGAGNAGTAYIYTYSGSSWGNEKIIRAHDNASGGDSHFGWDVAMNNNGTKVVVGTPYHDLNASDGAAANAGAAYVFAYNSSGDSWSEEQKIQASDIVAGDLFGQCVDINSDGTKIVVGSEESDEGGSAAGAAYVYTYSSGTWGTEQKIQASDKRSSTEFGTSASFNTDGTRVIVGAKYEDEGSTNSGAAYIFAYDGSNWNEVVKLKHRDRATSDHFGNSVAMSGDGKRVVVGAENEDDDPPGSASGAAYIFDRDTIHTVDTKLKLQSNTWHNLTYAYQGEGGSRVTYLDGRKVAEDQAFDSFQEYPNFSMTQPSQGGFKASSSSANSGQGNDGGRIAYKAFKLSTGGDDGLFMFNESGPKYDSSTQLATSLATTFEGVKGEWIKLEVPERIKFGYMYVRGSGSGTESPEQVRVLASNDDVNWDVVKSTFTLPVPAGDSYCAISTTKGYKYIALQVIKVNGATSCQLNRLQYYGHYENDLVRLPDPTNVLKYPHIAMTGPGQRGYVATRTTGYLNRPGWHVFGGSVNWTSEDNYNHSGGTSVYNPSNGNVSSDDSMVAGGNTYEGDWIQLQLPHGVKFTSFKVSVPPSSEHASIHNRGIKNGILAGSNNGSSWYVLKIIGSGHNSTGSGLTWSQNETKTITIDTNTTTAYKYIRLLATAVQGGSTGGYWSIPGSGLEFYGTGVDSIPIQIGGGNIDKVANFRVYDKFVGEDQALEIWDAQKDEFGRAKSSMTLQKGRLGIGTTEPQGRLAVLDEPELGLEGIQEFPPGPMSTDNTYIEGHGMFKSKASSIQGGNNDLRDFLYPFRAFDKTDHTYHEAYYSASPYNNSNGAYTATTYKTAGYYGEWLQLQLPYKIKLSKFSLRNRPRWGRRMPKEGVILAFDKEIGDWVCIHKHYDGLGIYGTPGEGAGRGDNETRTFIVNKNTDDYYDTFRFVTTRLFIGGSSYTPNIAGWRLFGTRESINRQSVLHDGRLTLTKSLDVPRIGPPVDRDDTPRRDRLVAEFNTYTDPMFNSTVLDTSGRNHHGIFRGLNGDDQNSWGHSGWDPIERALLFNSSSGVVVKGNKFGGVSGDILATISVWFRSQVDSIGGAGGTNATSNQTLMLAGIQSGTSRTGLQNLALFLYNDEVVFSYGSSNNHYKNDSFRAGSWHHLCGVKTQKGALSGSNYTEMLELYLNGKKLSATTSGGTGTLNLLDDQQLVIGAAYNGDTLNDTQFRGHISGVKFYPGTALTAPEVYTLYSMGRNGKICNPEPLRIERPLHSPGSVVQVEHVHVHDYWASSVWNYSYVEPMWITIKPKFANSKMLVQMMINYEGYHNGVFRVRRLIDYPATYYHLMPQEAHNTPANTDGLAPNSYDDDTLTTMHHANIAFVDWPKTCEAVTYRLLWKYTTDGTTGQQFFLNRTARDSGVDEHTISSIIVTEIAQ